MLTLERFSKKVDDIISFLAGIIFYNGVMTLLQGNIFVSIMSFLTIGVAILLKRFVDFSNVEE